mgnify:FL=1
MKTCSTFRFDPNELITGSLIGAALYTAVVGRLFDVSYSIVMRVMDFTDKTPYSFGYNHKDDALEVPRIFYDNARQLIVGSYNIQNNSSFCLEDVSMVTLTLDGEKSYRMTGLIRKNKEFVEMSIIFVCESTNLADYFNSRSTLVGGLTAKNKVHSQYKNPCELMSKEPVVYL